MKNTLSTLVPILVVSLLASALLYVSLSGSYVRTTATDQATYWIGPLSTTIPFLFWAMVTLGIGFMQPGNRHHLLSTVNGYLMGWIAMTAFSLWIVSFPRGPEVTSTMGIAVVLTPFFFLPIFPVAFAAGYFHATVLAALASGTGGLTIGASGK